MLTVHVKLFAGFRHQFPNLKPGQTMPIEVTHGTTTGQIAGRLQLPAAKLFFVNGIARNDQYILSDQDELSIMPPICGG
jgi:molybdopterin converting factor small subunit